MMQEHISHANKIIVLVDPEIKELIPGFLQNRHKDLQTIIKATAKGDYDTIKYLGHEMKGTGGGFGFDAISDIGRSLEQAAQEQDADAIQKVVEELTSYLNRVEVVFK